MSPALCGREPARAAGVPEPHRARRRGAGPPLTDALLPHVTGPFARLRLAREWPREPYASRLLLLVLGLFAFGLAIALMVRSQLGLGPWDAFHLGLARLTGTTVGTMSVLVGLVIVVAGRFIGVRPGVGTLVNMVLVGVFIDVLLPLVPPAEGVGWGLGYYAVALGLCGVGTGMYIAPGLGAGPRDGLMLGLSARSGWPVRRMRTLIELTVLAAGWVMGARVGAGTLLFTLAVGPIAQLGLQLFGVLPRPLPQPVRTTQRRRVRG